MRHRPAAIIPLALAMILCIACSGCSDQHSAGKSEMVVLDANTEEILQGHPAFSMVLDGNTSMQNSMELSENDPGWQLLVENTGAGKIVAEVGGSVYRVEAEHTALICPSEQWAAGTYDVSFASASPEGMQGKAICFTAQSAAEQAGTA